MRAFVGGIVATIAPYGVYKLAQHAFGLHASLANLTSGRLLACIVGCSFASPLLHHLWFALHGDRHPLLSGFLVMFVGDLNGTLLVVYGVKIALYFSSHSQASQD